MVKEPTHVLNTCLLSAEVLEARCGLGTIIPALEKLRDWGQTAWSLVYTAVPGPDCRIRPCLKRAGATRWCGKSRICFASLIT